jgi:hypothetical protein
LSDEAEQKRFRISSKGKIKMAKTIDLNIPRTAEERLARQAEGIHGLIERMEAKASDGRYYAFEDADREQAIKLLKRHVATHDKVLGELQRPRT